MKCFELRMLYSSCTPSSAVWPGRWPWPRCRCARDQRKRNAYLAGRIDDLGGIFLVLVTDDLAKRVLDGGIVALHKVTVDKLDRQARFACAVSLCTAWWGAEGETGRSGPTALLPTMAILRCLGPAMIGAGGV